MDKAKLAAAFNEWMRRFVDEPERFASEWQTVKEFMAEEAKGQEPSYGEHCAGYLLALLNE